MALKITDFIFQILGFSSGPSKSSSSVAFQAGAGGCNAGSAGSISAASKTETVLSISVHSKLFIGKIQVEVPVNQSEVVFAFADVIMHPITVKRFAYSRHFHRNA